MNKGRLSEATPGSDGEEAQQHFNRRRRQSTYKVDAEHFRARVLQDALTEALAAYWRRRARDLARALSRPGDYLGAASPEQVAERDQRIRDDIVRCCFHAQMLEQGSEISDDVRQVLGEVA